MTRRRVVNIASTKKRDTMVGANDSLGGRQFTVDLPNTFNALLWCATARPKAGRGVDSDMVRSADSVYFRGVKEKLFIEGSTSDPWDWRRIVFSTKSVGWDPASIPLNRYFTQDQDIAAVLPETGPNPNSAFLEGMTRVSRTLFPLTVAQIEFLTGQILKGVRNIDYASYMTASMDNTQFNVLSDRTRRIRSGNDSTTMKEFSVWHPMNKTINYRAVESGTLDLAGSFSTQSLHGMGDVYVLDFFRQPLAAPSTLKVATTATAYWHER